MKTLSNFIGSNPDKSFEQFVNESLENNTRIINEDQLLIEHGKDIDSLMYKFKKYSYNTVHGIIDESYDEQLSISEQLAARDLFIFVCEEYKRNLLQEYDVYAKLLNGEEISLNEKFELGAKIEAIWKQGKDAISEMCDKIKTEIKAFNDIIKSFALQTFSSLREFANKIVDFVGTLPNTLLSFVNKLGIGNDDVNEISTEVANDLINNTAKIKQDSLFESYAEYIQLDEGIVDAAHDGKEWVKNKFNNTALGKWWNSPKNPKIKAIIKAFLQFSNWALVCHVLPGVVMAIFPGSLIALMVPIAAKIVWNIKKIKPIIKQIKDLCHGWKTLKALQKLILIVTIGFSIYCWGSNMLGIFSDLGPLTDALGDSLKKGTFLHDLFGEAHAGIKPDTWTALIAAQIKAWTEGKSFDDSYNELMSAFEKQVPNAAEAAQKLIQSAQNIAGTSGGGGASKSIEDQIRGKFASYNGGNSHNLNVELLKMSSEAGFDKKNIVDKATYTIYADGSATGSKWGRAAQKLVDNWNPKRLFNKSLHGINNNAGSGSLLELTGAEIKKLIKHGILKSADGGDGRTWCIVAELAHGAVQNPIDVTTVSTFIDAFSNDSPIITYSPQNKALRIRLGDHKSKNYIYNIPATGTQVIKVSELKEEKLKKAYESIAKVMNEANNEFTEKLKKAAKTDEERKKIEELNYEEKLNEKNVITVFYGKKLSPEESKQYNESLSLYDYIISEAEEKKQKYDISTINDNFTDLRIYLDKIGINNNEKITVDGKEKSTYYGNNQMLLKSFFSRTKSAATRNFTWDDGKMKNGKEETDKYVPISVRSGNEFTDDDHFYAKDIENISVLYSKWLDGGYDDFRQAFIYILMLKKNFVNESNYDIVVAAYYQMVDALLKNKKIASEVKDREWTKKGDPWAPLKFDESDIDEESLKKVKEAEEKVISQTDDSPEDAQDSVPPETAAVTTPPEKKDEEGGDDEEDNAEEGGDDKEENKDMQPVLMFANGYGIDIADANDKGPRKEIYSLRGAFHSLEFIEFKGGMNNYDVKQMLGDMLYSMVNHLINATTASPIQKKKHWWKDKILVNPAFAENDSRRDFGNLTNGEVVDIIKNKNNAAKYIEVKTESIKAAETEDEKKQLEKEKETIVGRTLKAAEKDDEKGKKVKDALKAIDKDLVDKNGKVNKTKLDKYADTLANYNMARYKKKEKKGLWQRIVDAFKKFFTGKDDERRYKRWNSYLRESLNESQYDGIEYDDNPAYDIFEENTPRNISLKDYIKESLQ